MTFGSTFLLKACLDSQRTPHCEPGCVYCEQDGLNMFEYLIPQWRREIHQGTQHPSVRFDQSPRVP